MAVEGRVHSFETLGMLDGPGRRFVLFLQGCQLRCRYCHNPDSWSLDRGRVVEVEAVVERVRRLKPFYANGGGVTVSGGEPLLQPQFLKAFLVRCKEEGLHTCIDTAGVEIDEQVAEALLSADLVLLDLKAMDEELHLKLTGAPAILAKKTVAFLEQHNRPFWVRHVLVPGWTNDSEQLHRMGAYLATLKGVERVELLPFHQMARHKWDGLGLRYLFAEQPTPTAEELAEAAAILRHYGVPLHG